ncbi:hypothetical protein [Stagnihabitans tardus]|uniref:hypothetical protein n=1 Tax=Stagnihabitans tardus TaxID=2699202 RepID=UPI001D12FEA6|nr:hypothetical protein [Stagnihabitans tardus]
MVNLLVQKQTVVLGYGASRADLEGAMDRTSRSASFGHGTAGTDLAMVACGKHQASS